MDDEIEYYPAVARGVRGKAFRPAPPAPTADEQWDYFSHRLDEIHKWIGWIAAAVLVWLVLSILGALFFIVQASETS